MADFIQAYRKLLPVEGGYVNHPSDRGKETYKGISRRFHPQWKGWAIIDALRKEPGFPKNLTNHPVLQELVQSFYKSEFWDKLQGDRINEQRIADELFDSGVNMGIATAVRFLQGSLNVLNRNGRLFPDIERTGVLGPKTLAQLNAFTETDMLLRALNAYQGAHYIAICERDPSQEDFFRGWIKRAEI